MFRSELLKRLNELHIPYSSESVSVDSEGYILDDLDPDDYTLDSEGNIVEAHTLIADVEPGPIVLEGFGVECGESKKAGNIDYILGSGNVEKALKLLIPLVGDELESIDLACSDLSDEGAKYLSYLPRLSELAISGCEQLTGRGFQFLSTLPRLKSLNCDPKEETAEALSYIGQVKTLRELNLSESAVVDSDLASLAGLKNLEVLNLWKTGVCRGISVVEHMPKLRNLQIERTRVDDAVLESVGRCRRLEELWMGNSRISDKGLHHLRDLRELHSLSFDGEVSAAGFRSLESLKQLRRLSLFEVPIDAESAHVLAEMKQLDKLLVGRKNISSQDLKLLRRSLRGCDVEAYPEHSGPC